MTFSFLKKIFGSKHERDAKKLVPIAEEVNGAFSKLSTLSDDELRNKTVEFRARIKEETAEYEKEIAGLNEKLKEDVQGEERKEIYKRLDDLEEERDNVIADILDEILPEAFAVAKEACRRLVGQSWDITGHKVVWDMVPFDVQIMGAAVLHEGRLPRWQPAKERLSSPLCLFISMHYREEAHISLRSTTISRNATANGWERF